MSVIPYQPEDLQDPTELVSAIRKRRGGQLTGCCCTALRLPQAGMTFFKRYATISLLIKNWQS